MPEMRSVKIKRPTKRPTGVPDAVKELVWRRCGGNCEHCGAELDVWIDDIQHPWRDSTRLGFEFHHRRPRQMGGDRTALGNSACNIVLLCKASHLHIERHRTEAYEKGWLVHRWADPGAVPFLHAWNGWVKLTLDGTYLHRVDDTDDYEE